MHKTMMTVIALSALLGLASCDVGDSSSLSDSGSEPSTSQSTSQDPRDSSVNVEQPIENYWTDEEVTLMEEVIGHVAPFFDFSQYGLEYELHQTIDDSDNPCLVLEVEGADLSIKEAYIESQVAVDYEDQTSSYGSQIPDGLSVLYASYPDFWGIQQQVALYSDDDSLITTEGEDGLLQAVFFQDSVPLTSWPGEELIENISTYLGISDVEIPEPSEALQEGTYYALTAVFNPVIYSYFVQLTTTGDFTSYADDLSEAGWALISDYSEGATYLYSPDGSLGVYIYDHDSSDDTTKLLFCTNSSILGWPSETIDSNLTNLTGNAEHTPLPAFTGASSYEMYTYSSYSFYIYCYDSGPADDYIGDLEEAGFNIAGYTGGTGYGDPLSEYVVEVSYFEDEDVTLIEVSGWDDDMLTEWPGEKLDEYMSTMTANTEGFVATIPEVDYFDYFKISFTSIPAANYYYIDFEMYDYDENFDLVEHADDYYQELEKTGWEEVPELNSYLGVSEPLYTDSATRSVVIYIQDGRFGTNMFIQNFDVDSALSGSDGTTSFTRSIEK